MKVRRFALADDDLIEFLKSYSQIPDDAEFRGFVLTHQTDNQRSVVTADFEHESFIDDKGFMSVWREGLSREEPDDS